MENPLYTYSPTHISIQSKNGNANMSSANPGETPGTPKVQTAIQDVEQVMGHTCQLHDTLPEKAAPQD